MTLNLEPVRPVADEALWGRTLTPHQAAVLELVAAGLTNREIGVRLFMADHTAKFHMQNAAVRCGVKCRRAAVSR